MIEEKTMAHRLKLLKITALIGCVALAACASQPTAIPQAAPTQAPAKSFTAEPLPTVQTSQVETPIMNQVPIPTPFDASIQTLIDQAKADLAQRLGLDPSKIEVVDASSVTWPDASLGCPKPGMAYAQVMVDGMRLRLKTGDTLYDYHSGGNRAPFLCK
jgi:hypothetical protein